MRRILAFRVNSRSGDNLEKVRLNLNKWKCSVKKYRHAILILILGIILMCVPFDFISDKKEDVEIQRQSAPETETKRLQEELEYILGQIDGIGKVSVVLSIETGFEHVYQQNTQERTSDGSQEQEQQTALMTQSGNEVPLEVKTTYPTYKGAVVVCHGANKASVKLAVVQTVSSLTGLKMDRITVIKMKGS